ncbi:MAG: SHOCT domain-containing protein [Nanoarchaeota archaeon]
MEENKNVWIWVFVVVALLLLFSSFGMGGYGMMGFGFLFMLLFWGALIWLVITLINATQSGKKEEDPLNILKKRYALGEITKKQFEKMKKEIR